MPAAAPRVRRVRHREVPESLVDACRRAARASKPSEPTSTNALGPVVYEAAKSEGLQVTQEWCTRVAEMLVAEMRAAKALSPVTEELAELEIGESYRGKYFWTGD